MESLEIGIAISDVNTSKNNTFNYDFSDFMLLNDEVFYSRIILNKKENGIFECVLEINTSNSNSTLDIDFSEIKSQNFSQASILTEEITGPKLTHYYFWESESNPIITGQFKSYRLKEGIEEWQFILEHREEAEEAQFF